MLEGTDVHFGGGRDWDIEVLDERFYPRLLTGGSLALGESYMEGWWSCRRIDGMVFRLVRAGLGRRPVLLREWPGILRAALFNLQKGRRAGIIGERHYDLGNDLFAAMLDARMVYSCGYWKDAADLDAAQEAKLDLLCRKLQLEAGQSLLDIGCGWGGLLRYAAERYGVAGTGLTVSKQQVAYAKETIPSKLPVQVHLEDYRAHRGRYDGIVSVGMFEHVGAKNHRRFFEACRRLLRSERGLLVLQTIGTRRSHFRSEPWMSKYIFPNSRLPSAEMVTRAADGRFLIEDWQNFGADYDRTLMAWYERFTAAWPRLRARYGERFKRMWDYYLLSCAGSFRAREIQLWQIVFSPRGQPGRRYEALR
jgi:cyclopropane-fatty-acyl-phospholipid synthase